MPQIPPQTTADDSEDKQSQRRVDEDVSSQPKRRAARGLSLRGRPSRGARSVPVDLLDHRKGRAPSVERQRVESAKLLAEFLRLDDYSLQSYEPSPLAERILQSLLEEVAPAEIIAERLSVSKEKIMEVLRDPRELYWISAGCREYARHLFGMGDLAQVQQAIKGKTSAYRALLDRWGKAPEKKMVANVNVDAGVAHLSDEQLDRLIEEKQRKLGA